MTFAHAQSDGRLKIGAPVAFCFCNPHDKVFNIYNKTTKRQIIMLGRLHNMLYNMCLYYNSIIVPVIIAHVVVHIII